MSAAAQEAMRLAALGYKVFPCRPGTKIPLTEHGCLDATTDEAVIEAWFTDYPGANLAVSTDSLFVVDTDPLPDGSVNTWAAEVATAAGFTGGAGSRTPRGGTHHWFRQAPGQDLRNTTGRLAKGVDTRANGGYVLVYPSRTEHGEYCWLPGFRLDDGAESLPEPPDWIVAQLTEAVHHHAPASHIPGAIEDGTRNATLFRQAAQCRRWGWDQPTIHNHLRHVNQTRCNPPLEDNELEKIAWSVCRYEPIQALALTMDGTPEVTFYTDEVTQIPDPGPLPVRFLNPPGLMGELIDWNLRTAPKPQPELALAAAIALMAVLIGRKCEDQSGARTNLYMIGLAGSGGGKDQARKCNKELLEAAGLKPMIGPEAFKSDSGIVHMVKKTNPVICHCDEFGRYLEAIKASRETPHIKGVETILLKLFTDSRSTYHGDAYADSNRNIDINQPHLVIYGTSVPESFWGGMSKDSVSNGFCGRLMIVEASNNDPDIVEDARPLPPPSELVEMVKWWGDYSPGGNLSAEFPQPRVLEYTEGAKRQWRMLEEVVKAKKKENSPYCSIYARSQEKAKKLALIYQLSKDPYSMVIEEESAEWGCSLTRYFHSLLEHKADLHVTASRHDACCKAVLLVLKKHGGAMNRRQLELGTRDAGFNPREVGDALSSLVTASQIESVPQNGKKVGRPQLVYRLPGTHFSNDEPEAIMPDGGSDSLEEEK